MADTPEFAGQEEAYEPPPEAVPPGPEPALPSREPEPPAPPPQRPKLPTLQDLFKQLGLDAIIDPEPEPEHEPEPVAVGVAPEPVAEPAPVVEPEPEAVFHAGSAYDLPTAPSNARLPTGLTPRHWTPLQQMVIFKEVLDRPRGFRRGWEPRQG